MEQKHELHLQLFGNPRELADKIEYLIKMVVEIDNRCMFKPQRILLNSQRIVLKGDKQSLEKIKQKIKQDAFL